MAFRKRATSGIAKVPAGKALRLIRGRLDISQSQMGVQLGWPQGTLSQHEAGYPMSAEKLIKVLRYAAKEAERVPIIAALEARGIMRSDLSGGLLSDSEPSATSEGMVA